MANALNRFFKIEESGSTIRTEIVAGVTTFMTMAYIIFVNPAILSQGAGMDFNAVMVATCISASAATMLMALLANYPIAQAPGMGINALFSYQICASMGVPWKIALGMVFLSGTLFMLLTALKFREILFEAIPQGIKHGIAAGIGTFIAFIGLKEAGIVVPNAATFLTMGDLSTTPALVAIAGLVFTAIMMARRIKGAILLGILCTGALGIITGIVEYKGLVSPIPSMGPTWLKLDIAGALRTAFLMPIATILFLNMFDTIGTLIGVGEQAGLVKNGKLPRAGRALFADAVGTTLGSLCGTSPLTSYIESATGVSEGGRTGFASVITALLLLLSLFFSPLAAMFGSGYRAEGGAIMLHPVTAPALIVVGSLMMQSITKIRWASPDEAIPAFLTIVTMPLTFSISNGLAIGFVSYPVIKLGCGKGKEVHWMVYLVSALLIALYLIA
jgi:AGZA family xanthine/uracil permease-like MFS transporter